MVSTTPTGIALILFRLVLFGLSLGLTLTSFRAYRTTGTDRLKFAFIGFAFISMGVAVTNLTTQLLVTRTEFAMRTLLAFEVSGTVLFCVGFGGLYYSLYR